MKNFNWLFSACWLLAVLTCSAQSADRDYDMNQDKFKQLQIGYSKTTSIVFPYAIKSIDRGSQDVLVQKARGVENILLLKAARQNFGQTNLTVVTADSKLYVFVLNYNEDCPDLNFQPGKLTALDSDILFSLENEDQKKIESYSKLALSKKKKASGPSRSKFDIKLAVDGIFIHQDVIYFRLLLGNNSRIGYEVDQLRFFIRDQKKSARTAWQEIEIIPIFSTFIDKVIPDESEIQMVCALPKFTIPEKKYLTVQLIEKKGGRQIEIDVRNNDLIGLDVLNSF